MEKWIDKLRQAVRDEKGGHLFEYVVVAGLIVLAAMIVIGTLATPCTLCKPH